MPGRKTTSICSDRRTAAEGTRGGGIRSIGVADRKSILNMFPFVPYSVVVPCLKEVGG